MKLNEVKISTLNVRDEESVSDDLKDLIKSIETIGLLSKVVLRKKEDSTIELIAGLRRFLSLKEIRGSNGSLEDNEYFLLPETSDINAFLLSLDENIKRKNLSPFELNKAALYLNRNGKKDKDIAEILGISPARLKRIYQLSIDKNNMTEEIRHELKKPDGIISDMHWERMSKIQDKDILKDVYDQISEKQLSPRELPALIKSMEKNHAQMDEDPVTDEKSNTKEQKEDVIGPIEYAHKGELQLEMHDGKMVFKVIGGGEDKEVPIDHYLEFLKNPTKFKCYVTFKLKVKPID